MTTADDIPAAELEARAVAAAWRSIATHGRTGAATDTRSTPTRAEAVALDGKRYVRVLGAAGCLAVYRVRPRGELKRMARPPKGLL